MPWFHLLLLPHPFEASFCTRPYYNEIEASHVWDSKKIASYSQTLNSHVGHDLSNRL